MSTNSPLFYEPSSRSPRWEKSVMYFSFWKLGDDLQFSTYRLDEGWRLEM